MTVFEHKINISGLKSILAAAENLQDAGENEKAKEILIKLADNIKEQVK